jgi:hypothetical protein
MKPYYNPTADKAIGSMSKEWGQMARLALQIREGRMNPYWVEENTKKFTGIYKRLLDDPIDEVREEARN